ncbi:CG8237 [Drosophila busckii]|uniref:CG8237 n=1 Tax=Drosophila busckii TaxID=30019 RepID=A0A0M4E7S3_DROBS|nr:protein FAM8A1 [Drosophila busckii]ALC40634.1 CG8237 [Drosophila busckii]
MGDKDTSEVATPQAASEVKERKPYAINKELSTKEAYFASLEEWAKQAALIQMFPNYFMANYSYPQMLQSQFPFPAPGINPLLTNRQTTPQLQQQPQPQPQQLPLPGQGNAAAAQPNFNRFRVLDEVQQQEIIQRVGGTEVVVAPFWKRAVAEAIDMVILFILKIIVTFSLFHVFDLAFDKDVVRKTLDEDDIFNFLDISMDFLTLSSDLLLIELVTKLIVCLYECLWTVFYHGATPGKSLMKIRIVYVEAVVPLQPPVMPQFVFQPQREPLRAVLYPAETPGFIRALMRAFAKNLVMTLLFPICVVMIFFKNNCTVYDIITKTIVVEANSNRLPAAGAVPQPQAQVRPHQH